MAGISLIPCLVVGNQHAVGAVLVFQVGTHDVADDVVALLHHRVKIGLLAVAERTDDGGIDIEVVLVIFLDVVLEQVTAREIVDVLIEVVIELRHTIELVHHTIGGRDVDGIVGDAVERLLREGMVLGIERDDGLALKSSGYGVVVLRDVLLHELLDDGGTIAGPQTIVFSLADGGIDRCPDGIEPWAVECLGELALLSQRRKLGQLRVAGDILPQRLAGTGQITCRRN